PLPLLSFPTRRSSDLHDRRQRLEPLDELPHDAEDPPGVLDREIQHGVPARRLQATLLQRVSTSHDRSRLPGRQTSALLDAVAQAVLAQVLGQVPGVDTEQAGRLL